MMRLYPMLLCSLLLHAAAAHAGLLGVMKLNRAAQSGDTERVRHLLAEGLSPDAESPNGETPLFFAAWKGGREVVAVLLDADAEVNHRSNDGRTALIVAATFGNTAVVRELLSRGADVNAVTNDGWTALRRAQSKGYKEIAEILAEVLSPAGTRKPESESAAAEAARPNAVTPAAEPQRSEGIARLIEEVAARAKDLASRGGDSALLSASAAQIGVRTMQPVDTANFIESPIISPDGRQLAYVKRLSDIKTNTDVKTLTVMDLKSRAIVKQIEWTPELREFASSDNLAWSPDASRILVVLGASSFCVFDLGTGRVIKVDSALSCLAFPRCHLIWFEDWKLLVSPEYHHEGFVFDLETLQRAYLYLNDQGFQVVRDGQVRSDYDALFGPAVRSGHPRAYLAKTNEGLAVLDRRGEYSRVLFRVEDAWDFTPDLRYVVWTDWNSVEVQTTLWLAELQASTASRHDFWITVGAGGLGEKVEQQIEAYQAEGASVYATVFSPRINPLTGRTIGANYQEEKATLKFVGKEGSRWRLRLAYDKAPIVEGDVVGIVFSEEKGSHSNALYVKSWFPLE